MLLVSFSKIPNSLVLAVLVGKWTWCDWEDHTIFFIFSGIGDGFATHNPERSLSNDLGGGFKYCLCSPQILGEMIQFDFYFSTGLEPPARDGLQPTFSVSVLFWRNKSSNEN